MRTAMDQLRFGTAGIPIQTNPRDTLTGIATVKKLGLQAMELEFVRSINVSKEKAPIIKKTAEDLDVLLTCHGQYFVNLNAQDKKVLHASIQRILDASRIAAQAGCWSICYHMAYYSGVDPQKVYAQVKDHLKKITTTLKNEGHDIWIRPETGGKINQFADSYELIKLASELDTILPCFDLAHQFSRTLGKWNTKEDFRMLFCAIESQLGKRGLNNMHCHTEGIEFTDKGERNHVNLAQCKLNYKELVEVWKEFKIKGVIICESPNIEEDALLLQRTYNKG